MILLIITRITIWKKFKLYFETIFDIFLHARGKGAAFFAYSQLDIHH